MLACLAILQGFFPHLKFLRIGKVRELIFDCGKDDSNQIIRDRFGKKLPSDAIDLVIGWNQADDKYNCRVQINPVSKGRFATQSSSAVPGPRVEFTGEFGIKVLLDVNNRVVSTPLNAEAMQVILEHADGVYRERLLTILNGGEECGL